MENADTRDKYIKMLEEIIGLYEKIQKENIQTHRSWIDLLRQGRVDDVIESIKIILSIEEAGI